MPESEKKWGAGACSNWAFGGHNLPSQVGIGLSELGGIRKKMVFLLAD